MQEHTDPDRVQVIRETHLQDFVCSYNNWKTKNRTSEECAFTTEHKRRNGNTEDAVFYRFWILNLCG